MPFGQIDGRPVRRATLGHAGLRLSVLDYGAVLQDLSLPLDGGRRSLCLGLATAPDYADLSPYFGAVCGRFANRIKDARFALDGTTYELDANDGRHHLHGGAHGLPHRFWEIEAADDEAVVLGLVAPAGEGGYPGTATFKARYAIAAVDTLDVELTATVDAPCPINLTHHAYWNLDGEGTVARHRLRVAADAYLPADADGIPTGEVRRVEGTVYDFRGGRRVGDGDPKLDHCYVLNGEGLREVAELASGDGRVRLTLFSDQPGLQVYNGYKLDVDGSANERFSALQGLCLEPQAYPDAPNRPDFPDTILGPGETYRNRLRLQFHIDG